MDREQMISVWQKMSMSARIEATQNYRQIADATSSLRKVWLEKVHPIPFDMAMVPAKVKEVAKWKDQPDVFVIPTLSCGGYLPTCDVVGMPTELTSRAAAESDDFRAMLDKLSREQFVSRVFFHEFGHATGSWNRLSRFTSAGAANEKMEHSDAGYVGAPYVAEEVIAEWTATILMARANLTTPESAASGQYYANKFLSMLGEHGNTLAPLLRQEAERAANYIAGLEVISLAA